MANSFRNDTYRSAKGLSIFVVLFLGAIGILSALFVVSSFVSILFPDAALELDDGGSMRIGLMILGVLALLEVPLRWLCVVFFLVWLYRCYNNLSALKARNLEFSPGWAVGWWFIPFANLVKPFQVVREVYNESSPDFDDETGFLQTYPGTPEVIGFWWASFLLSGFIYRISDVVYGKGDLPQSSYFEVVFIAGALLATVAAGLAIFIVVTVVQRQDARYARLTQDLVVPQSAAPGNLPEFPR